MLRRDYTALRKIAEEVSIALEMMGSSSLEEFLSSEILKRAAGMTAINIGELVKNLSSDFRLKYSNVAWKQIAGFRDVAAHKYGTLDMHVVYDTVTKGFPALKASIEEILMSEN